MNQRATEYNLNDEQFEQLMDKYVMTIVDSMIHEDFRQFVIGTYYDDFSNYTLSQLLEEIKYTLDDEMLDEFVTTIKEQLSWLIAKNMMTFYLPYVLWIYSIIQGILYNN